MSIFKKLFSGGLSEIVNSVGGIVDKFTLTKEEKNAFKLEMQSRLMQIDKEMEETYRAELEARADIIKAEMAQGDKYTKRARPTIVYAGLVFIFILYVFVPVISYLLGNDVSEPPINLPEEFWWAWGTVVGVYGAGRSAEKMGVVNKITNLATGSGVVKQPKVEG